MKGKVVIFVVLIALLVSLTVLADTSTTGLTGPQGPIPSWDTVVQMAKQEGSVSWYAYGAEYDKLYFDSLIPKFEKQYGIKVNFIFGDWYAFLQKLLAEQKAGQTVGDMDLVFTWSIPFNDAWNSGVVWKYPWSYVIPNARNIVDPYLLQYTDMIPTNGAFVPFIWWQVAFLYNKQMVKNPPQSWDDLMAWVKANPGKFTYCDPNAGGSGHTFLITLSEWLYGYDNYYDSMGLPYNKALGSELWNTVGPKGYSLWGYLKELQKYMYQPGFYPAGNSAAISLFSKGVVWLEPQWLDVTASWVKQGLLDPNIVGLYIPKPTMDAGGMDGLFIPYNAPHKYAAMVLANYLLSNEVQTGIVLDRGGAFPVVTGVMDKPDVIKAMQTQPYWVPFNSITNPLWLRSGLYMDELMKDWTQIIAKSQ